MKNIILPIAFLFATLTLHSQPISHVEFAYDDAGNRTTRQVIYLKSQKADSTQQLKEGFFQQNTDSVEFKGTFGNRDVSIFPNPTKGILTIAMANLEDENPVRLELFSLSGEMILQQSIRQGQTTVDLTGHPGAHEKGFLRLNLFGHANYFMDYDHFNEGLYMYSGPYNPFSLWGR